MKDAKIYIAVPVHNRPRVVAECLPTLQRSITTDDCLVCYDDGSQPSQELWLHWQTDQVKRFEKPIGIEKQRRLHFEDFWMRHLALEGFTHMYLTDSDALHDTNWRAEALRLQEKYGDSPICLYNTEAHIRIEGNTIEDDPASEVIWRCVAPGISYFLTTEHVRRIVDAIVHMPDPLHWDWSVPAILGHRMAVSRVGYVDHIGLGGMHHPESEGADGGDRVKNPTDYLVKKRAEVVAKLSQ